MKRLQAAVHKFTADKKLRGLLILFGVGLVLLLLSVPGTEKKSSAPKEDPYQLREAVEEQLETRLVKLLSSVEGVGRVKVLVTVETLQTASYAQNSSAGGAADRTENEYVIVEENGSKTGLTLTVSSPVIRGVAVSCEGGGSARVRQEVTGLVCAALGVGASRVYVSRLAP